MASDGMLYGPIGSPPIIWSPAWGTTLEDDVGFYGGFYTGYQDWAVVQGSVEARNLDIDGGGVPGTEAGVTVGVGATLTVANNLIISDDVGFAQLVLAGGLVDAGRIDSYSSNAVSGYGTLKADLITAPVVATHGLLELIGTLQDDLEIDSAARLDTGAGISSTFSVFGTLQIGSMVAPDGIEGFISRVDPGGAIDLLGRAWQPDTTTSLHAGTLTVTTHGSTDILLHAALNDGTRVYTSSDGAGGMLVTTAIQSRHVADTLSWGDAATWIQNVVPGAGDIVDINSADLESARIEIGSVAAAASIELDQGSLTILAGGTLAVGTLTALGSIELAGGVLDGHVVERNQMSGFGTINADLSLLHDYAAGGLVATGGTLELSGTVNVGEIRIFDGATLRIDEGAYISSEGSSNGRQTVWFYDRSTLAIAQPVLAADDFQAEIAGFRAGRTIDLLNQVWTPAVSATLDGSHTVLTVANGSTVYGTLHFAQRLAPELFTADDGHGGTLIETTAVACYCRGTLIATSCGEVPVEALHIGDRVTTRSGEARPIKWIGTRSYDGRFIADNRDVLPIRIRAGALGDDVPRRDLLVSPHHAMFVDGVLVPAELLINGVSIVQEEAVERVEYFHIELESHDVLLAEGAPAESFVDCDSRAQFQNAAEFAALYPDAMPEAPRFCAPRIEGGVALVAIRARLAARAGLAVRDEVGPFIGQIDEAGVGRIAGWAEDAGGGPVAVQVMVDDAAWPVLAGQYRADLGRRAGFALNGVPLSRDVPHLVRVRRESDGAELAPVLLPPLSRVPLAGGDPLALIAAAERLTRRALRRAG